VSFAPTLRCPCEGRFLEPAAEYDAPPAGETQFDLGGQPYRRGYDRCAACAHWFGRHALDLSALYDRAYVDGTYGGAEGMRRRFEQIMALPVERSDNRQRVACVLAFARSRGIGAARRARLLDVGAGLGVFPAAMAEAGWDVTALEPDLRTVDHLQRVVGVRALPRDLLTMDPSTCGVFDAITFNKVLEHVEDPVGLLVAARPLVAPAGFVYVEVPDVAAGTEGPGREEFFIEHHHVFSPASLVQTVERAGLVTALLERLREPSSKFTLRAFATAGMTAPLGGVA
jgi:SAM-dependent methyltransferase